MLWRLLVAVVLVSFGLNSCSGKEISVNATEGLQWAVSIADDGDEIVLSNGTFSGANNTILFLYGRTLSFRSESGDYTKTTINCQVSKTEISAAVVVEYSNTSVPSNLTTSLSFSGITFEYCGSSAGAIRLTSEGITGGIELDITNCQFSLCESEYYGGAIFALQAEGPVSVTVATSVFQLNLAGQIGGAIFSDGAAVTITNSVFSNNQAAEAGGALFINATSFNISGSTLSKNEANEGAGIYLGAGAIMVMTNVQLNDNLAVGDAGGGILVDASTAMIYNSQFSENVADSAGGAIGLFDGSEIWVYGSQFTQNSARARESYGGAVYATGATVTATSCNFTSNSAQTGGAFAADSGAILTIISSFLESNVADYGGAVATEAANTTLQNSTVSMNTGKTQGGAFYLLSGSSLQTTSSIVTGNTSPQGASLYCTGSSAVGVAQTNFSSQNNSNGVACSSASSCQFTTDGQSGNWANTCAASPTSSSSGLAGWAIALIVIFVLGAVAVAAAIAFVLLRRKHDSTFLKM